MSEFLNEYEVYKLVVQQLHGCVITDKFGRYVYVGRSWEKLMGKTYEEVKGKYVRDVIPNTKIHEVLETKKPITGYPLNLINISNEQAFCNYLPIFKDGEVIAGFIYVIFYNEKTAFDFSRMLMNMKDELNYYQEELRNLRKSKYSIDEITGESKAIYELKKQIRRAARSSSTVLIEGETGSGKELVAHSIHDLSQRSVKPLIKVNCAAIPSELFESELFGYEYGAFTGAKKGGKQGKFELANDGSLFLDEINQMSMVLQPKLLRVLQEKEIEKLGGKDSISIDARLIVATNVPLEKLVRENQFRSDLYYRLNVVNIKVPPLRERKDDIPLLADNIINKLNFQLGLNIQGIDNEVLDKFYEYNWPGNIRELQNVIERGMNLSLNGIMKWEHFEEYFENKSLRNLNFNRNIKNKQIKLAKKELEKEIIINSLEKYKHNKTKCAKELGISRTLLYKKLKEYNIVC